MGLTLNAWEAAGSNPDSVSHSMQAAVDTPALGHAMDTEREHEASFGQIWSRVVGSAVPFLTSCESSLQYGPNIFRVSLQFLNTQDKILLSRARISKEQEPKPQYQRTTSDMV